MGVHHFFSEGPFTYVSPLTRMSGMPVLTQVSAQQYLAFARTDLEDEGDRAVIYAMDNAKRLCASCLTPFSRILNYSITMIAYGFRNA